MNKFTAVNKIAKVLKETFLPMLRYSQMLQCLRNLRCKYVTLMLNTEYSFYYDAYEFDDSQAI